jgi:hypothetical protein
MRMTFACLTLTCCAALAAAQQPAAHFERELPPAFRYAQDIRWAGPDLVYVSDGRDGVYEISTASRSAPPRRVMNGATQPDGRLGECDWRGMDWPGGGSGGSGGGTVGSSDCWWTDLQGNCILTF